MRVGYLGLGPVGQPAALGHDAEAIAVLVRPARPDDGAALALMWQRCSSDTKYQRFHGVVRELPALYLRRCLSGQDGHIARVAEVVGGGPAQDRPLLIGLVSAGPATDGPQVYELGALVEDGWQRRGIGGALMRDLFAACYAAGVTTMRMDISRSQPTLIAHLLATTSVVRTTGSGLDVTVEVDVPAYAIAERPGAARTRPPRRAPAPVR